MNTVFTIEDFAMTTKNDIIRLRIQATLGNVEAMYELGYNYLYGIGTEVNILKAHKYLQKAANKDFRAAKLLLAIFADNGLSAEINADLKENGYEKIKSVCQNADQGDPEALYLKAIGKLSDDIEDYRFIRAINDLKKACQQEYAPALFALGRIYHLGKRVLGKESEGLSMIQQAADKEFIPAIQYMMGVVPKSVYPIIKRMSERSNVEGEVFHMLAQYYRDGIVVEKDIDKSISLIKASADKGYKNALHDLGVIYEFGKYGISKDINIAIDYFEKGVLQGDSDSMLELGWIFEQSNDCPHNFQRAFELYSKASELNNSGAINNLGTCYKKGIGTEMDKDKALDCYIRAAKLGNKEAFWNLYLYYMDSYCTEQNFEKAVEWLKKGDEAGCLECTYQLTKHIMNGDGIERDANCYFHYVQKAAMGGYMEAYGSLGRCYTYGIGTQRDEKKAVECYKKAAEKGYAQAQFDLGICYRQGEGVEKNPLMAIEWYLKAAEQGHGDALCNLGIMYDNGIGVDRNPIKAFEFFKKSATAGSVQGQFCLGELYFSGRGTEQNYKEAVKCFKEAANQGEPDSMYHLAICYKDGLGVEKDLDEAIRFLYAAAKRGHQKAIDIIKKNKNI